MDQAIDDHVPILVTRQGGKGNVVMMSEADYDSWQETIYLMSNPANATRLLEAKREADAGLTVERELIDPPGSSNL
jgi:antitoxin YefM